MSMKRFAVFAKKTQEAQQKGDYTIWHFLNDTDDLAEATHWFLSAKEHKDYCDVELVQSSYLKIEILPGKLHE